MVTNSILIKMIRPLKAFISLLIGLSMRNSNFQMTSWAGWLPCTRSHPSDSACRLSTYPFITLLVALAVLVGLIMAVRLIWRALRQVFSGRWMPAPGLMQAPRVMERRGDRHEDDNDLFDELD